MKIAKYALAACIIAAGFTAIAQDEAKKSKCKERKAQMMESLDLSDDQRAEIEALREEMKDKRATLKADESLDEASRKEEMKSLHAEKKAAMNEILSEEQQAQLKEMKKLRKAERKDLTPEEVAEKQTAKMKEVIDNLTAEQEERLYALNMKVAMKIDAIKKNDSMTDEKKKEFIKGNKKDKRRMLETILTTEQLKQWDDHKAENKKLKKAQKNKPAVEPAGE